MYDSEKSNMSHFCADVRMINNSGIGVYIREYIKYILDKELFEKTTLIGESTHLEYYFGEFKNWVCVEASFPIYSIQEQIRLPFLIPLCDVFWSPHYNIPLLPIRAKKRLVTIPDVFHLANLHTLSVTQKLYAQLVTNLAVRLSDKIITISDFSAKEIVRLTGINTYKIKTIFLGINRNLFCRDNNKQHWEEIRFKYQLPERYILFVGNVKPNKNLRALVEGFAYVAEHIPDYKLLIAGKKDGFINGDKLLFKRIDEDNILSNRVVFSGYVESNDLSTIYTMASLFAFPSLYEGFGFPPLEAMACGCPVVASNMTSIPEICGNAAYYINPNKPEDISRALLKVLNDNFLRDHLIDSGLSQVEHYSWGQSQEQFVKEICTLYKK